jgi:hypothetical protein
MARGQESFKHRFLSITHSFSDPLISDVYRTAIKNIGTSHIVIIPQSVLSELVKFVGPAGKPDKPQAFCIITRQTTDLLYYYLTNHRPSVLLRNKPQPFSNITLPSQPFSIIT